MAKLLVYSHANAMTSSRRVEGGDLSRCGRRGCCAPTSIPATARSRASARHHRRSPELSVQTHKLCQRPRLVGPGTLAVNGTNLRANASRHKAMSYERTTRKETGLEGEIAALRQNVDALRMAGTTADRLAYFIGCPITWLPPRPRALPVTPASGPSVPESEEAAARSEAVHARHPHHSAARTSSIHAIAAIAVGKPAVEMASSAA